MADHRLHSIFILDYFFKCFSNVYYVGNEMTESWYNERTKYDYRNPAYQPGTGHFTQVVWKGSEEVGFGRAQGTSMNFAVAMYYPPGNYMGDFDRNVFPPN